MHRVLLFKQKDFLKPYINKLSTLRANANSVYEKNIFKLISNSTFGKFLEVLTNRLEAKICNSPNDVRKAASDANFVGCNIVNENTVISHCLQKKVKLNRSNAIGFTILELSKAHMIDSFYNFFRKKFQSAKSLFQTPTVFYLLFQQKISTMKSKN